MTLAPLLVDDNVSVELCGEELASVVASQLVDELHELGPELHKAAIDEDADVLAAELVEVQVEVEGAKRSRTHTSIDLKRISGSG